MSQEEPISQPARMPFLTARWESLVLLNYACTQALLEPLVPPGTVLDDWNGQHLISLVGFMFRRTRVMGFAIPGHQEFEEVNLRFYVRRTVDSELRRAVVFIRELVPRRAIAAVARWKYNEPYLALPMSHSVSVDPKTGGEARYRWTYRGEPFELWASATGPARPLESASKAEFITEHYWGYTRQRQGGTLEYQVEHPPWLIWAPDSSGFTGVGQVLYGSAFGEILAGQPDSVYLAVGSDVVVHKGRMI
jgi:uncharacterized protein YqjF (DUF2071 family)